MDYFRSGLDVGFFWNSFYVVKLFGKDFLGEHVSKEDILYFGKSLLETLFLLESEFLYHLWLLLILKPTLFHLFIDIRHQKQRCLRIKVRKPTSNKKIILIHFKKLLLIHVFVAKHLRVRELILAEWKHISIVFLPVIKVFYFRRAN